MDKIGSGMIFACVCLAIFLIIIAIYCECLRRENRQLRSVIVEQYNTNKELWTVNDDMIKLNDELLETVDELTKKLNGGE